MFDYDYDALRESTIEARLVLYFVTALALPVLFWLDFIAMSVSIDNVFSIVCLIFALALSPCLFVLLFFFIGQTCSLDPCFMRRHVDCEVRGHHLAITQEGIRAVHIMRKASCGGRCEEVRQIRSMVD